MNVLINTKEKSASVITTIADVSRKIGITPQTLRNWRRKDITKTHKHFIVYFDPIIIKRVQNNNKFGAVVGQKQNKPL